MFISFLEEGGQIPCFPEFGRKVLATVGTKHSSCFLQNHLAGRYPRILKNTHPVKWKQHHLTDFPQGKMTSSLLEEGGRFRALSEISRKVSATVGTKHPSCFLQNHLAGRYPRILKNTHPVKWKQHHLTDFPQGKMTSSLLEEGGRFRALSEIGRKVSATVGTKHSSCFLQNHLTGRYPRILKNTHPVKWKQHHLTDFPQGKMTLSLLEEGGRFRVLSEIGRKVSATVGTKHPSCFLQNHPAGRYPRILKNTHPVKWKQHHLTDFSQGKMTSSLLEEGGRFRALFEIGREVLVAVGTYPEFSPPYEGGAGGGWIFMFLI